MENFKNFLTHLLGKTDKHGNPYTKIDGKKYLINPTKNITMYGISAAPDGHPAYTRYGKHMKPQPTDATYTPWEIWFAWKPVTTLGGDKVWFKTIYKRQRTVKWTPPQFPPNAFDTTQYATWDQIVERELTRS